MSNKEATQSETWWVIFIVVAMIFICDLFIVDPIPFIDEFILCLITGGALVTAIVNTINRR